VGGATACFTNTQKNGEPAHRLAAFFWAREIFQRVLSALFRLPSIHRQESASFAIVSARLPAAAKSLTVAGSVTAFAHQLIATQKYTQRLSNRIAPGAHTAWNPSTSILPPLQKALTPSGNGSNQIASPIARILRNSCKVSLFLKKSPCNARES
jgi:hypothetical protein